jgi:hypothetical protein
MNRASNVNRALRASAPAVFLLVVLHGCSSGNSTLTSGTNSGPTTPTPSSSSMTAQINGVAWTATSVVVTYANGILTITGTDNTTTLGIGVAATGPATVTIGLTAILTIAGQPGSWQAAVTNGSGSITLATLVTTGSARSASGTFLFNLVATPGSGSSGTKTISGGTFNVSF